ncbi:hypothetical protein J3R30DRAFT_3429333 [Lentinula aciculospora]|uniref:Uncharacterized protein n=1 Tax=Lentinula aciculospora TaxID=153920 RepID=A0A9W9ASN6_9AGAR|nr:hypothetical protein J3R30DRAFT_3429333 [Lentinula aciculospora]
MHLRSFPFLLLPGALFFLTSFTNVAVVGGTAVNRSIDDTLGDSVTGKRPMFLPTLLGTWEDETCAGCALQPPTSSAFRGTYTAATYNPGLKNISITFDFAGTAIYIFFILANNPASGITAATAANFTLDQSLVGTFSHSPNSSAPDFQFNQSALVFSKTGLKNISHNMVISTSGLDEDIWVNFDYALYTFQEAAESSSSKSLSSSSTDSPPSATASTSSNVGVASSQHIASAHTGVIVGGVVGGLAMLGILIGLLFICHRRRRKQNQLEQLSTHDDPESGCKDSVVEDNIDPLMPPSGSRSMPHHVSEESFSVHQTEVSGTAFYAASSNAVDSTARSQDQHTAPDSIVPSSLPEYQYQSVISTLPSGRIVMAPRTAQDFLAPAYPSSVPVPSGSSSPTHIIPAATTTSEKSELRRIRQQELERQMRDINEEIEELKTEAAKRFNPSSGRSTSRTSTRKKISVKRGRGSDERVNSVAQLKAQIREMSSQIALLQSQQNSAWAQGLSDGPPPGYSPRRLVANEE